MSPVDRSWSRSGPHQRQASLNIQKTTGRSPCMSDDQGEFNLRDLNDQELTEQVHDDLYNGLKNEVEEATHIFLERGWNAEKTLNDALVEGMRIVGIDFRDGILFVPEVLLAANSMKGGMEILRPLLAET